MACLRENGISTARPYKDIAAVAAAHHGYTGGCPRAEHIAQTVMVIPCHHALEAADVERIATCVNRAGHGLVAAEPARHCDASRVT